MKLLKNIFDSSKKHFEKGKKLERLRPLFEATETVFFSPADVTKIGPHVRDSLDIKRFMVIVLITLIPPLLFGIYNTGYYSRLAPGLTTDFLSVIMTGARIVLPIVIVSYVVGFFWEILFAAIRRHSISEGFFVTAMLFPLTLPPTIPLWQVAVGISFGIVIGKEIFGGTGRNFLNPALTARAFLFFAYPSKMSGDIWIVIRDKTVDTISSATPLAISAAVEMNEKIETVLAKAGYSFTTLFLGHRPGSIGETSALLAYIGAFILIIVGIASYRIVLGGIAGVLITGYMLNFFATETSMSWLHLNPFYHLVMGGFAFGLAFMATEPVTAPHADNAKWVYGFCIGMLTVLIRVFNPAYTEGVMLAILFMNVFAPLLDHIEVSFRLKRRIPMSEKLKPFMFAGILCLVCSLLLTVAASGLKERQDKNIAIDRHKNILKSVGLIEEDQQYSEDAVEKLYSENIRSIRTDSQGKILRENEKAERELPLYLYMKGDEMESYVIPIETQGLWGTIYGYLSVKNDGSTVTGFTVYKHSETPGLGGEIEKRWFQKNFEGKKITDQGGSLVAVAVAKGAVKDLSQEKQSHYVDGIGGATLTGKFLTSGLKTILQEYEPVAVQFRKNKNVKFER